jgi:hypothetical protein
VSFVDGDESESGEEPDGWEWLLLVGLVVGAVLIAALPIAGGILVTGILPGLAGLRPGVPLPLLLAWLVGIMVKAIVLDGPLDRAVDRLTQGSSRAFTKVAQETAGLGLLSLLLRPVMADWPSALVAALIAALLYLLTSPLVEAAERRRTRRQEADS